MVQQVTGKINILRPMRVQVLANSIPLLIIKTDSVNKSLKALDVCFLLLVKSTPLVVN